MATSIFRLLSDLDPSYQEFEYFYLAPNICAAQRALESVFLGAWFYGSFVAVLFREDKITNKLEILNMLRSDCKELRCVLMLLLPRKTHVDSNQNLYYRFVLMKYPDRGLADDRFWFNGGLRLFNILFWISTIFFILSNLGILSSHYFYHDQNVFLKAYRSVLSCSFDLDS